jgi:hypothetical protein
VDAADNVILDAAREAALKFTSTLPDFVAQQSTERSFTPPSGGSWQPIDVVTAEVTYSRGRESYRNVQIDGRPTTRSIESTGNWSTGEFGMVLEGLMAEDSKAQFRRRPGSQRAGNRGAWVFDFSVAAASSHWVLVSPDKREYTTAFTGSVWIDQETRRVIRIERKTVGLPQDYPLSKSESIINYGYATIDKTSYLLPAGGGERELRQRWIVQPQRAHVHQLPQVRSRLEHQVFPVWSELINHNTDATASSGTRLAAMSTGSNE